MSKKIKMAAGYGMIKIKDGQKVRWVSVENKHGWSLGLELDSKTIWLRNTRFQSPKEICRVLNLSNPVFTDLK